MVGPSEHVLVQHLATHGYRARVVSVARLLELRTSIEDALLQGLLDRDVYDRYMAGFSYSAPNDLPDVRSVIVVAYPDPPVRFTFTRSGHSVALLVPPTYLHSAAKDERLQVLLTDLLSSQGCRAARAHLPVKLLAVRSGLADYGRNNITYVAGMGSFYRLVAFHTELPCEVDDWCEPRLMPACRLCRACSKACPTGAIPYDRVRVHAERCITFWNEKPWQVGFPGWMVPGGHNSLVGCMHCQHVCPENARVSARTEDGGTFSENETRLLCEGATVEAMPPDLIDKLRRSDLFDLLDVLPRNLRVLLK